jgi:hypothetical protein
MHLFIFIHLLFLLPITSYGYTKTNKEHCPTPEQIRLGQFQGWQAVNANSNYPANAKEIETFKKHIGNFYQAEVFEEESWNGHCYYYGYQEVYLGKWIDFQPNQEKSNWHFNGIMWRCQSNHVSQCLFN